MIDVMAETVIDLSEAAKARPLRNSRTGKPAHLSQVYRWISEGARALNGDRVRLETIKSPSGLRTSKEAVDRFIRRLSSKAPNTTPIDIGRAHERAERELAAAGL